MNLSILTRGLDLLRTPGALSAFRSWPIFSLAAYQMISRAKLAGVHPETVVDIGANAGQFAVAAAHLFPRAEVLAVEPDPRVAEELRKNLGDPFAKNVRAVAVGDAVGTAVLNVNRDSQVSSLLALGADRIKSFPHSTVVETISVPLTTLDALFDGMALQQPVLLKIDVQGYEDRVLAGAHRFLTQVQWAIVEVPFGDLYRNGGSFRRIADLLQGHGLDFCRPLNFHVSPVTGEIIEMDALFQTSHS